MRLRSPNPCFAQPVSAMLAFVQEGMASLPCPPQTRERTCSSPARTRAGLGKEPAKARPQDDSFLQQIWVQFQRAMKPGFCLALREMASARPSSPVPSSSNEVGSGVTDICSTAGAPFDST